MPNGWLMPLFAIMYFHALFPVKGAFASGVLIALFLLLSSSLRVELSPPV